MTSAASARFAAVPRPAAPGALLVDEVPAGHVAAGVGAAEFNPGGGLLLPHHFASSLGRGELAKVFLKPRPHPTPLYPLGLFVVVESYLCNVFLFFPVLKDIDVC